MSRQHIKFNISFPTILLNEVDFDGYLSMLFEHKEKIRDINIAARIPPMIIDAHGIMMEEEFNRKFLNQMYRIQAISGIPVSLTLNNIYVPNDRPAYDQFVENYKPFYERGFTHLTLPHITWMDYGFKDTFPLTDTKITTIRKISTAQDFWNYAQSGFDLINVDRRLQRNKRELQLIRKAQEKAENNFGRRSEISIVCNESCVGTCRYFDEHYAYVMNRSACNLDSIRKMKKYSCLEYPSYSLRRFSVLGLRNNIDSICESIDVIKLAGRKAEERYLYHPFDFIDWFYDDNIQYPAVLAPLYMRGNSAEIAMVEKWSSAISNCNFQCWDCSACNELENILAKYYRITNKGNKHEQPNIQKI